MKIYFSGSIYGGRQKVEAYKKIIAELNRYGTVLNPEVADDTIFEDETKTSDSDIFKNLEEEMNEADIIFAEVTVPSLGVGYELGYCDSHLKKIICIYDKTMIEKVTTMLRGNDRIKIIPYENLDEIISDIKNIIYF